MKWSWMMNREREHRALRIKQALFTAIAFVGAVVLVRELPAMRRYWRIERM